MALKSKDPGSLSFSVDYDRQHGGGGCLVIWSPGNTPPEYRVVIIFNAALPTAHFRVPAMCPGPLRTEEMSRNVALIQPQRSSLGQGSLLRGGPRPTDTLLVPEAIVFSTAQSVPSSQPQPGDRAGGRYLDSLKYRDRRGASL